MERSQMSWNHTGAIPKQSTSTPKTDAAEVPVKANAKNAFQATKNTFCVV